MHMHKPNREASYRVKQGHQARRAIGPQLGTCTHQAPHAIGHCSGGGRVEANVITQSGGVERVTDSDGPSSNAIH